MKTHIMKDFKYTYCGQAGRGSHSTAYALSENEVTEAVLSRPITCQKCVKGFRRACTLSPVFRARLQSGSASRPTVKLAFSPPEPCLAASEIAAVMARFADVWRGSDEAPALRSAAGRAYLKR